MRPGTPPVTDLERYNHVIVDNINVYMPKSLYIPGNFSIDLWRFFWLKGLTIDGWKLV